MKFRKQYLLLLICIGIILVTWFWSNGSKVSVGTKDTQVVPKINLDEADLPNSECSILGTGDGHSAFSCSHPSHQHSHQNSDIYSNKEPVETTRIATQLSSDFVNNLGDAEIGEPVNFKLPDGKIAKGILTQKYLDKNGDILAVDGTLEDPSLGRFNFRNETVRGMAWPISGVVIIDDSEFAYRAEPSHNNEDIAELVKYPIDQVICRNFLKIPESLMEIDETIEHSPLSDHPTDIPIPDYQNGVIPLQSLPGVTSVIYLDFDGQKGPHESWGNFDALPSRNLSVSNIFQIWRRVAEDFAPFRLNVTTDEAVYLNAPQHTRQRCIITPTTNAARSAAGVALVGSYNRSGDIPCWSFYQSGKGSAEVISHEIGHALRLTHDGRTVPDEDYYSGHGSGTVGWSPIMGLGFYKNLSHWSKGEYRNPTNRQDDTRIIALHNNNVGYRIDDIGNTAAEAIFLEIFDDETVKSSGIISTSDDIDFFAFTTTGGQVNLNINPETYGPNLDISVVLYDSSNNPLLTVNPDRDLNALISTNLPAGDYTIAITGTGRGDPLQDGYTDYASLGNYTITGTIVGGLTPIRFSIPENSLNGTNIGTITPRNDHGTDSVNYVISTGNDLATFALDSTTGDLTVADVAQFDYEKINDSFAQSAELEIMVNITNPTRPALNETRRVVISVTDLNEPPIITDNLDSVMIPEGLRTDFPVLKLLMHDPDQYDIHNWSIVSGNTSNTFQIDNKGLITIANPPDYTQAASYTLEITTIDSGSPGLRDSTIVNISILDVLQNGYVPGSIICTYYRALLGDSIRDLTNNEKFPESPDSEFEIDQLSYNKRGSYYGVSVRAYLIAPYTGDYTFWVSGDNSCQLHLSTDTNIENTRLIAESPQYTARHQWYKYGSQQSQKIPLIAGEVYYLETLHKESNNQDHFAVAWNVEFGGETLIDQEIIPAIYFAPHILNYSPKLADITGINLRENCYPGTYVAKFNATEINTVQSETQTHTYTITNGDPNKIFSIDPHTGEVKVDKYNILDANMTPALIEVTVTDTGNPPLSTTANLRINIAAAGDINATGPIQEFWDNLFPTNFNGLYSNSRWPNYPNRISQISQLVGHKNNNNYYGTRIRAYLTPEISGNYTFYINTDDHGNLLLSPDDNPINAISIASINGWTSYLEWDKYPQQTSNPIYLEADKRYFIEAQLVDIYSLDHLNVAWTGPGITDITLIPSERLTPYDSNTAPTFSQPGYSFRISKDSTQGTVVGTVFGSSQTFEAILHAILSGDPQDDFEINPLTGEITLNSPSALTEGKVFNLTVGAQDDGYRGLFPLRDTTIPVSISVPGGAYQNWRDLQFNTLVENFQIAGDQADPDHDSIPNLIEYALNLDPNTKNIENDLPQLSTSNNKLYFTYRKNLSATDMSFNIQKSEDLSQQNLWSAAQVLSEEIINNDGDTQLIRATLENSNTGSKSFFRLKVEPSDQ